MNQGGKRQQRARQGVRVTISLHNIVHMFLCICDCLCNLVSSSVMFQQVMGPLTQFLELDIRLFVG
jgi:hypothetical protein